MNTNIMKPDISLFGNISSLFDDVFGNTFKSSFFNDDDAFFSDMRNKGLKKIINRPHNLITVKDENGKDVAQKIEIVTTPFKKEDIKVQLKDDILTVVCGSETKNTSENEVSIYHGISSQTFSFSLKIGENVDSSKISAKNSDGILKIILPFKEVYPEKKSEIKTIDIM